MSRRALFCTSAISGSGREWRAGVTLTLSAPRWTEWGRSCWFVDGNHEDFGQLAQLAAAIVPDGRNEIRPNILHLPRGYRWEWHGLTWLACGGGVSLDEAGRTEGIDWWPQEEITSGQEAAIIAGGHADVMVCHDCPVRRCSCLPAAAVLVGTGRPGTQRRTQGTAAADRRRRSACPFDARAPASRLPAHLRLRLRPRPRHRAGGRRQLAELRGARRGIAHVEAAAAGPIGPQQASLGSSSASGALPQPARSAAEYRTAGSARVVSHSGPPHHNARRLWGR